MCRSLLVVETIGEFGFYFREGIHVGNRLFGLGLPVGKGLEGSGRLGRDPVSASRRGGWQADRHRRRADRGRGFWNRLQRDADRILPGRETLSNGRFGLISYAHSGQEGHHPVNGQPPRYWLERFAALRSELLPPHTSVIPKVASMEATPTFFAQSALLFARADPHSFHRPIG